MQCRRFRNTFRPIPAEISSPFAALLFAGAVFSFSLCALPSVAQQGNEKTFATPGDASSGSVQRRQGQRHPVDSLPSSEPMPTTSSIPATTWLTRTWVTISFAATTKCIASSSNPIRPQHCISAPKTGLLRFLSSRTTLAAWYFDTETGKTEILQRRVGTNENDAIEILHGLVDAQRDYASQPRNGDTTKHYALRFLSDEGKQNGLYWKTNDNDAPSPIGPLMVSGTAEGYNIQPGQSAPFHGYYYRILTKQGSAAKGGALDYVVNGNLTRGFAFVAYPAAYRNSGVMTFIVNQNGVVYQKDLGPQTSDTAAAMQAYDPDDTWEQAD